MLCKTSLCRGSRETCRTVGGHKTKYACIVEADESMRIRMEGAPHCYHEDHIAGPRYEFIESLQSSAQIHSDASRFQKLQMQTHGWDSRSRSLGFSD